MKRIKLLTTTFLFIFPFLSSFNKTNFQVAKALDFASGASYYENNENDLYYQGISSSLVGEDLIVALSTLTSSGFVNHSYSALPEIYQYSDQGINNPDYMRMVYTGTEVSYSKGSLPSSTNKEHVWPASWYGNGDRTQASGSPGADAHNVWPSASDLNSKRGSCAFDELDYSNWKCNEFGNTNYANTNDPDSYVYSTAKNNSNGQNTDVMMPKKGERGIIARTLMYVATRYRNNTTYPVMLHDNPTTLKIGRIGKLSTLLKWHYEEPPSEFEMRRNNEIATRWHHNRNPFVDHPEFAGRIYYYLNEPDASSPTLDVRNVIENYDPSFATSKPESVVVDSTNIEIKINGTYKINPSILPQSANQEVKYSSFDNNIISVSNDGLITAKSVGSTTLRVSSLYYSDVYVDIAVNVYKEPVELNNVSFKYNTYSLLVGEKFKNDIIFNPLDVYPLPSVTYSINNSEVATINDKGEVEALKEGNVTINATIKQNDKVLYASYELKIKEAKQLIYEGTLIKSIYNVGDVFDPTGLNFKIKLSDESIVSIDNSLIKFYDYPNLTTTLKENTTQIKAVYLNVDCLIDGITVNSINKKVSFDISSFSASRTYSWYSASKDGVNIKAFIYGGNNSTMQFNNSKNYCYIYNNEEISNLVSISLINNSLTASSSWKIVASNSPFEPISGNKIPSDYEKDLGSKTISSHEYTTFDFDPSYKYFAICYIGSGACYLDEIVFNLSSSMNNKTKEFVDWINDDNNFIDLSCREKYILA